jgi:hypothetical protein
MSTRLRGLKRVSWALIATDRGGADADPSCSRGLQSRAAVRIAV